MRPRGTGSVFREKGSRLWRIQFYQDGRRIRENTGLSDRAAAQKVLTQRLHQANRHEYVQQETRPVRVAELFEHLKLNVRWPGELARSWEHLGPVFGSSLASRLTTDAVLQYRRSRQQEGAANATINRELACLKRMFNLGRRSTPPKVQAVPYIPLLEENNVRRGFIEDAEFRRLTAEASELWLRTFLELGYTYGWRKQELLSLQVRQVNLASRTIRLDVGSTKNGEGREVVMTATVAHLLGQATRAKRPDDYVLTREGGRPVKDFRKAWRQLTTRAELPGLLVHDLRRSAAKALRAAGVPESVVMAMGGWKTAAMFRRYAIVSNADQQAAVEKLERARATNSPDFSPHSLLSHVKATTATVRKPQ